MNPVASLVDLGILVPVVVARDDVDRVNAVCVKEDFTEAGAIDRAIVGIGLEGHDAAGASMPSQVPYQQLRASEDFCGERRRDGWCRQRRGRSMDVCSMIPYGMADPASIVAETGKAQKRIVAVPSEPIVDLMPSKSLRAKDE